MDTNFDLASELTRARPILLRIAQRYTRDDDKAEDLVQETCCKACLNLELYTQGTDFRAWLSAVMRNLFLTEYNSSKRRQRVWDARYPTSSFAIDWTPESQQAALELAHVKRTIDSLPEFQRRILVLAAIGCSQEEISESEGIAVGTVKSRVHRARMALLAAA